MTDCQCLYCVLQVSPSFFYNPNIVVSIDIRYQAYLLSATYNLWAAVSHFNYFLLDGSIGSIPVSLLYIGWQYRQYPCFFTLHWMAVSAVSYSITIYLYILFLEFIAPLLGKNSSFLGEKNHFLF